MTTLRAVCLIVCVLLTSSVLPRDASAEEKKPKVTTLTLKKAGPFKITLPNNPSTGYMLALKSISKGFFLISAIDVPPKRRRPGASGTRVYTFFAPAAVNGTIVFARFRSFDFRNTYSEEVHKIQATK